MMVAFGGRTSDQTSLCDTWGLRRHRDGRWDWVKAPYKANGETPTPRYQNSTLFIGSLMMVIGGRTNQVGEDVALEVYDTESSEWYKFKAIQRFRHSSWEMDSNVYVHGGFEHETPNIPIDAINRIDAQKLFANHSSLLSKIYPK
jgi:protein phosphatase